MDTYTPTTDSNLDTTYGLIGGSSSVEMDENMFKAEVLRSENEWEVFESTKYFVKAEKACRLYLKHVLPGATVRVRDTESGQEWLITGEVSDEDEE